MVHIAIPRCTVREQSSFGKNKSHKRYHISDTSGSIEGIAFFAKDNDALPEVQQQRVRAIIGLAEQDFFRNTLRFRVVQIFQ